MFVVFFAFILRAVISATGWPFCPMEHCFTSITVVLLTVCVLQTNDDDDDDRTTITCVRSRRQKSLTNDTEQKGIIVISNIIKQKSI